MKKISRFMALVLCLCLLPVFSLAASDTAAEYEVAGIAYFVPSSWEGPIVDDIYTYFYVNGQANPLDGFLMIMDMNVPDLASSGYSDEQIMQGTIDALAQSMGAELTSEPMDVNGQAGKYFLGNMTLYGELSLSGYITVMDSRVISIVVVIPLDDEVALRETLNGILGITAE